MGSSQSTKKSKEKEDVNSPQFHLDTIRELNSRFSNTLAEIQRCYDFIDVKANTINSFSKNKAKLFDISIKIFEELNQLSKDGDESLHIEEVLTNLDAVQKLISTRYISSRDCKSMGVKDGTMDGFIQRNISSDYDTNYYLDSGYFSTAPIFGKIDFYLKEATNTMSKCMSDDVSRIGDVLDYYLMALELYELKIIKEIGFYEGTNTTFLQKVRQWTFGWFSWMSRSGNGYSETAKKWRYILNNIVRPMKIPPSNLKTNYKKSYQKLVKVIEKLKHRDYAISAGVCDKLVFDQAGIVSEISIGNVCISQFSDIIEPIEKHTSKIDIYCQYNKTLPEEEKWNDINGIIFYSDNPFSIEKQSSLRVYLRMLDGRIDSKYCPKKKKFFISSALEVLDGKKLLMEIIKKKNDRLVNQTKDFRNVCVMMGMGKNIIANYQKK